MPTKTEIAYEAKGLVCPHRLQGFLDTPSGINDCHNYKFRWVEVASIEEFREVEYALRRLPNKWYSWTQDWHLYDREISPNMRHIGVNLRTGSLVQSFSGKRLYNYISYEKILK